MSVTSVSLLNDLRTNGTESAWQRLVELYTPLIRNWLARQSIHRQDGEDLVQEVLAVVVRKLPGFERQCQVGSFRRWLRTITFNCMRDYWRRRRGAAAGIADVLEQLEDSTSPLSQLWDREHDAYIARRLLALIRPRFQTRTWLAFQRVVLEGAAVEEVAADLGVSVNAVFIAKSRVVHLLREEARGLLD